MTDNPNQLEATITIPEGMSDEQVTEFICELTKKLDEAHRDLGGQGLDIVDVEITDI